MKERLGESWDRAERSPKAMGWSRRIQGRAEQRGPVSAVQWIICPHTAFRVFKDWNRRRRPLSLFSLTRRPATFLFSLIKKVYGPDFIHMCTHVYFSLKSSFLYLLCFVLQDIWFSFLFLLSWLPGQSQNTEYLERKKGKPANRLPIFFVSFRDYCFSSDPPKTVLFEDDQGKESVCESWRSQLIQPLVLGLVWRAVQCLIFWGMLFNPSLSVGPFPTSGSFHDLEIPSRLNLSEIYVSEILKWRHSFFFMVPEEFCKLLAENDWMKSCTSSSPELKLHAKHATSFLSLSEHLPT